MADNNLFYNDFEKQIIITKLPDFNITFVDKIDHTSVSVDHKEGTTYSVYSSYTGELNKNPIKKPIDKLCNYIIESWKWRKEINVF